jgi:hypothetical protein
MIGGALRTELLEEFVVEIHRVVPDREVADPVDVRPAARRRIEDEDVLAAAAGQSVVALSPV